MTNTDRIKLEFLESTKTPEEFKIYLWEYKKEVPVEILMK